MTIDEFKAFLEGMDVQGQPTPEQWARIKEKIDALEAVKVETFKYPDNLGMPMIPSPYNPSQTVRFDRIGTGTPDPALAPYSTC